VDLLAIPLEDDALIIGDRILMPSSAEADPEPLIWDPWLLFCVAKYNEAVGEERSA
jgi:hypothetical protein